MLTALALVVPVVLIVLFCVVLKLALPAEPWQETDVARPQLTAVPEPAQRVEPPDRRAA